MQSHRKNVAVLLCLCVFAISIQSRCVPGFGKTASSSAVCIAYTTMKECFAVASTGCIWDPIIDEDDESSPASLVYFMKTSGDFIEKIEFNQIVTDATQAAMKPVKEEEFMAARETVKAGEYKRLLLRPDGTIWDPRDHELKSMTEAEYAKRVVTTTTGPDGAVYDIHWKESYLGSEGTRPEEERTEEEVIRSRRLLAFFNMPAADPALGIWQIVDPAIPGGAAANAFVVNSIQVSLRRHDVFLMTTAHDVFSVNLPINRFFNRAGLRWYPGDGTEHLEHPRRVWKSSAFTGTGNPSAEDDYALILFRSLTRGFAARKIPSTRNNVARGRRQLSTIIGYDLQGTFDQKRSDTPLVRCWPTWCEQNNEAIVAGLCGSPYFTAGQTTHFFAMQSIAIPGAAGASRITLQRLNWIAALAHLTVLRSADGEHHARARQVHYGSNLRQVYQYKGDSEEVEQSGYDMNLAYKADGYKTARSELGNDYGGSIDIPDRRARMSRDHYQDKGVMGVEYDDVPAPGSPLLIGGVVGASAVVIIVLIFCLGLAFGMIIYWGYAQKRALDVKKERLTE